MSVPVQTVITRAKTLLQDLDLSRWTSDELVDWASEGEIELVKIKPDAHTKTIEHQLVAGAKQSSPVGSIEFVDVRCNVGGNSVTPCDKNTLDRFSPGWMKTPTASSVIHWADDPNPELFWVYPAQNSSPSTLLITHACMPPALTANGNLNVRDIYQENIVNYMVYRGLSKDAEHGGAAERALAYYQAFAK